MAERNGRYGVLGYAVIAGVVLLILAGAVLLVMQVVSSITKTEPTTVGTTPAVTACSTSTWFNSTTGVCEPRAVCAADEEYVEASNTCIVPPPDVDAIEPSSGLLTGGTEVRITGSGFRDGAEVTIDGVPARDVTVVDEGVITATTPGSPNLYPVDVEVINPEGEPGVLNNAFTYVGIAVERITEVSPTRGSAQGGEAVIIKGNGFLSGVRVAFGGRPASDVEVLNPTTLRVVTPAGSVGPVTVNVRNPGEAPSSLADGFRYTDQAPRRVTAIRPAQGAEAGGTRITITGSAFEPDADVSIGGSRARGVIVVSSTRITAVTPPGALGPASVSVRNPGLPAAILADAFTYVVAPTVTSVRPAKGSPDGGTKVTIIGTGFAPGATVRFGSAAATDVRVVNATRITAVVPKGKAGTVAVTVTNEGQPSGTLKKAFTYDPDVTGTPDNRPPNGQGTGGGTTALPACKPFKLGGETTFAGIPLDFTASDLFPSSSGVKGGRLVDASFTGDSGDGSDGSITWRASPPRIEWQAPDEIARGGTITFSYQADNCSGTGTGVRIQVATS